MSIKALASHSTTRNTWLTSFKRNKCRYAKRRKCSARGSSRKRLSKRRKSSSFGGKDLAAWHSPTELKSLMIETSLSHRLNLLTATRLIHMNYRLRLQSQEIAKSLPSMMTISDIAAWAKVKWRCKKRCKYRKGRPWQVLKWKRRRQKSDSSNLQIAWKRYIGGQLSIQTINF